MKIIVDNIAVAETTYGKIRGFIHEDIYNFLGIPYGVNTAWKNRFMTHFVLLDPQGVCLTKIKPCSAEALLRALIFTSLIKASF
jgi:carboxylesterase type B